MEVCIFARPLAELDAPPTMRHHAETSATMIADFGMPNHIFVHGSELPVCTSSGALCMSSAAAHWSPAVTELVQLVRTRWRENCFVGTWPRRKNQPGRSLIPTPWVGFVGNSKRAFLRSLLAPPRPRAKQRLAARGSQSIGRMASLIAATPRIKNLHPLVVMRTNVYCKTVCATDVWRDDIV